ncbi:helix-turn-helix domain-containing protein [Bacteroides sp.]
MEEKEVVIKNNRVNHGRNIRRTRENKGIGQTELAELVHLSQPTVSRYEMTRSIDKDMLLRFAQALKVPVEYLETLEEDAQTIVFQNNTITNTDNGTVASGAAVIEDLTQSPVINPIDKMVELYERLLKEEKDKVAALEKRVSELEKKYEGK